jgi:ABC-type uncharacterized transport system permease subunit
MTKLARELLFPLIAVVAAFIVGGILILLVGDNPFTRIAVSSAALCRGPTASATHSFRQRR